MSKVDWKVEQRLAASLLGRKLSMMRKCADDGWEGEDTCVVTMSSRSRDIFCRGMEAWRFGDDEMPRCLLFVKNARAG